MRTILSLLVLFAAWLAYAPSASADETSDSKGWVKLGEQRVDRRLDRDVIELGRDAGQFSKLRLVVDDSDLELLDLEITFANGEQHRPALRHHFREGARSKVIDLPGNERAIRSIELRYRNTPGGGRAHVEIWGWQGDRRDHDRARHGDFDPEGWTKLGARTLNARADRDRIYVARGRGKFSQMTIVVRDGDIDLMDFSVKFRRGAPWNPDIKHAFREGQHTRVLDFPGDERTIRYIDVKYAKLHRGPRPRIEVWAR